MHPSQQKVRINAVKWEVSMLTVKIEEYSSLQVD